MPFSVRSHPMVQISIYDSARTMLAQAEHNLRLALAPGLYRVDLERGGSVHHQLVAHRQDTALTHPGPELQSPAPFVGARTSHDYYVTAAHDYSRKNTAPPIGDAPHTSRLFVFIRREERGRAQGPLPSEPITIRDADGRPFRDANGRELGVIAPDHAVVDPQLGYVAYSCQVAPGAYRLRAARSRQDAAIFVPDGRAALVFIADTGSLRLADLRLALVPVHAGFDPASRTWSAMENLIAALRAPDRALPLAARLMLPGAVEHDLCFGIAAAHVLWRTGDHAALSDVMPALMPYREIPDVAILARLASSAADPSARRMPAAITDTPPLLRASLTLAMTRPELDPGTLSAYSSVAHAARSGVRDSAWCVWSTRAGDERWIEPAVEHLRARDGLDAASIARSLALATETVEQALQTIDAATPGRASLREPGLPRVPGYALAAALGRGPRSTVYRARRVADGREVALKIAPVSGGGERCAEALQALERDKPADHPQLLAATAHGTLPGGGGIWLEMELCHGSVLDLLPDADALPLAEAHRIVVDALAVLAHLHAAGIAHGDLKPTNLLVRGDRSVALSSPGLATRRAGLAAPHASDAPRFTPSELLSGIGPPTQAADVWAMAATYYFLLTRDFPHDEFAGQSQLEAAMNNDIVSLAQRRPELPDCLVRCIDQALSPVDRPPDAAAFRQQLASLAPAAFVTEPSADAGATAAPAPPPAAPVIAGPRSDVSAAAPVGWPRLRMLLGAAHGISPRRATLLVSVAVLAMGGILWAATHPPMSRCEQQILADDWSEGVKTCRDSGDQQDRVLAARGYLQLGDLDSADAIARQLIPGSQHADGFAIAADVELRRGQLAEATAHAMLARIDHVIAGDLRGQAGDAVVLSRAAWEAGDFAAARDAAGQALDLARRSRDPASITAASLASADALRQLGEGDRASATLADALEVATGPCSQASLRLSRALCSMDTGHMRNARSELENLLVETQACRSSEISSTITLTQAWLLRWIDGPGTERKLDELAARFQGATEGSRHVTTFSDVGERLDPTERSRSPASQTGAAHRESAEALLLRAYLAADRGQLDRAEQYLDRAWSAGSARADLRWKIAQAQGELAELRGGPLTDQRAEDHYRRATALIASSRGAGARSASFVASHRPVYDDLIALLARNGRWRDALAVILELDHNDMLRATRNDLARAPVVRRDPEDRATGLYRAPRAVDTPSAVIDRSRLSVDLLLEAWRSRDLVIVVAPSGRDIGSEHERVYRIHVVDGGVTGQDVAKTREARRWADELRDNAGDRDPAQALGSVIVPPDSTRDTLDVLATAAFSGVPLPALRGPRGGLVIAQRPLVRVLGLQATGPESAGSGPPVVIAEPPGNVLAAVEGAVVAATLAATRDVRARVSGAGTGIPATRDRLREAHDARLLHIATRSGRDGPPSLELADGNIDAVELVRAHIAPRLAVLAGDATAAAMDDRGSDSPAAGLLRAGTAIVIATARSVINTASIRVMQSFYTQPDWETDPARAFARVQQTLAGLYDADEASSSWAAFSVLGRPPYVPPG